MAHLPPFAALRLAIEVEVRAGECEGGTCDRKNGCHGGGRADEVQHGCGGGNEGGGTEGEGENCAEVVFVL